MPDPAGGPRLTRDRVTFRLPDPQRRYVAAQLLQELRRPRAGPRFDPAEGGWTLDVPRPDLVSPGVDRMEYRIEVQHRDGGWEALLDPGNPLRATGPFGDTSELRLPHYAPPRWIDWAEDEADAAQGGTLLDLQVRSDVLGAHLPLRLWTSAGGDPDDERPLLLAHDGPELAAHADLLAFGAAMVRDGRLPPHRIALLGPVDRDETYAASPVYARALTRELLPLLAWLAPARSRRPVGLGASLGGLAMLHVHRTVPDALDGLFLQSASCFRRSDRHEASFGRFRRIVRFVDGVLDAPDVIRRIPVGMTCGTVEENLPGNVAMAEALRAQGYEAVLTTVRDAHHWRAWRDAWDPHLVDLLSRCWRVRRP